MRNTLTFGKIVDDVYYLSGFEDDVGAGFIKTEEGIIVVDTTMLPTSSETLLGIIKMLYPKDRIVTIINTHVHVDHHFGNEVFIKRYPDAEIISHERFLGMLKEWAIESGRDISTDLPKRMMQRADMVYHRPYLQRLKVIPPTKTISTDFTLQYGDTTIQLLCTPGHTEDSLTVYLPKDRVLFASDSIYPTKRVPVLFMGDPDAWIHSLERLLTLDIEVLLPGHGWIPKNPQAEIKRHIEALRHVKKGVIEIIQEAGGSISYSRLEQKVDFLKGRHLLGVIRALVKRGIIEANNVDLSNAELKIKRS
jgi:glyoxylase-like metal-dependent hydrolase (beta-lactamase superfamily II)